MAFIIQIVEVLLMPLFFGQQISSNTIHGKDYGYYSLMEFPTHRTLHQFFLEYFRAHIILVEDFQPLSSSRKASYKVATLGRLSLLPGILFQSGAYLHTFYDGSMPLENSLLIPLECIGLPITNLYLFWLYSLKTLNLQNMELHTHTRA